MWQRLALWARICFVALSATACGGGGGGGMGTEQAPSASISSGTITAFGSVFVNGHEFHTTHATVTDDDTGISMDASSLEVGMVVTIKPTELSTDEAPEAAEIHISPLARGFVDASDGGAGTLTVMGQTVKLTSGTAFSDHRACTSAATPCAPIAGQAGLSVTSGTIAGTFVAVHGYLFSSSSGNAQIIATLVSVLDYTTQGSTPSVFKLEGVVTAVDATPSVKIGAESVDLSHALCAVDGQSVACASAFHVGDVVAARGTTPPTAGVFAAQAARLARLLPQTPGATVEIEGKVASVTGTTFVVRGIAVDGSALPMGQMPAPGDKVEVLGVVASDGQSIKATRIERDEHAASARLVLAGPLTSVAPGTASGTFSVVVLGQTATVTADTRIADRTTALPTTFNIGNFQSYLQGKSIFVVVRTIIDGTGALQATGFDIVPAPFGGFVGVAGAVDAAPVALGSGTSTVMVHGVSIVYLTASATVAKGSIVFAKGTLTASGAIDTTVPNGRFIVFGSDDHDFDFGD
jgi:hypothetical protein